MTILFSSLAPVNTTPRRFGAGLFRSVPTYRADHTAADDAWLAADNARRAAEDRHYDAMAAELAAHDRYERGLCC